MNRHAMVYDNEGRVTEVRTAPKPYLEQIMEGYDWVEVYDTTKDDVNSFVDLSSGEPKVKDRHPFTVDIHVEGLKVVMSGIPVGSKVEVMQNQVVSDEEDLEIEFDSPGTYVVEIFPPPKYLDETLEVTVG